jgi:hypothetical protein
VNLIAETEVAMGGWQNLKDFTTSGAVGWRGTKKINLEHNQVTY